MISFKPMAQAQSHSNRSRAGHVIAFEDLTTLDVEGGVLEQKRVGHGGSVVGPTRPDDTQTEARDRNSLRSPRLPDLLHQRKNQSKPMSVVTASAATIMSTTCTGSFSLQGVRCWWRGGR